MRCPKCDGLMYQERLSDFFIIFHAWKCVNCGALMDRTILNNQKRNSLFSVPARSLPAKSGRRA
jgi:hypothetical protein